MIPSPFCNISLIAIGYPFSEFSVSIRGKLLLSLVIDMNSPLLSYASGHKSGLLYPRISLFLMAQISKISAYETPSLVIDVFQENTYSYIMESPVRRCVVSMRY
jgi:hypothetical protein